MHKDTDESRQRRWKSKSPDRGDGEECAAGAAAAAAAEPRTRSDWTRKLVGSIRRKVQKRPDGGGLQRQSSASSLDFQTCRLRRKLSDPRKKDTKLLALIFKKQSSFDVKPSTSSPVSPGAVAPPSPMFRLKTRSCGQVADAVAATDPTVRENFLRATMSIFLSVSPPGRLQVGFHSFRR